MGSHSSSGSVSVSDLHELWSTADDPDVLRQALSARYDLTTCLLPVGGRTLSLLVVRDTNKLLDAIDPAVFARDERLPYWAEIWPSSIELARYCLEDLALDGRSVLELGCGLGVSGIAAAMAGAQVTLSDYEEDALAFARWNVLKNLRREEQRARVRFQLLDWRAPGTPGRFDLVLGSDIIYERSLAGDLLRLLDSTLRPGGVAVLTDPDREPGREFISRALAGGFGLDVGRTSVVSGMRQRTITRVLLRRREESS